MSFTIRKITYCLPKPREKEIMRGTRGAVRTDRIRNSIRGTSISNRAEAIQAGYLIPKPKKPSIFKKISNFFKNY